MKHCNECNVDVKTGGKLCPLCENPLTGELEDNSIRIYPPSNLRKKSFNFAKRTLLFLSIISGTVSLVINFYNPEPLWWSLIVITVLAYAWAVIPHSLRRGGNFAGKIFTQVICGIGLVVLLDFFIGWRAWSVNFVAPTLLCVGIVSVGLVVALNSTNWYQYVIYQILLAIFGFVPIVLFVTGIAHNRIFALITCGFAVVTLLATIIFGDRRIKNEFKRRLRF